MFQILFNIKVIRFIVAIFILILLHSYFCFSEPKCTSAPENESVPISRIDDENKKLYQENSSKKFESVTTKNNFYFYEPFPLAAGQSLFQIGLSLTLLPLPIVENEYPAPFLEGNYKLGIFENVSYVASLSTIIVASLIHNGIQYNLNFGNLSLGIANHIGAFIGTMTNDSYFDKNFAYAIFYLPYIRFGYNFGDFSVSLSLSYSYVLKASSKVSKMKEVVMIERQWNDFFTTLVFEQNIFKKTALSIGFSLAFERSPYQTWALYNTVDQYFFVPEFFFSFAL